MPNEIGPPELRAAVRRFQVCWDCFPELSPSNHGRDPIGWVVELYGTHDEPGVVPTAGCKHCIPVLQALLAIAEFAVPDEWRDALRAVRAHSSLEYAAERGGRPDVVVAITAIPETRSDRPGDVARCLTDIETRLRNLGACKRTWRAPGPQQ